MRELTNVVILFVSVLSIVFILPSIFTSINRSHQVKPLVDHSIDSAFIPKFASDELQLKAKELQKKIKDLKKGNICDGSTDEACDQLKKQYDRFRTDADLTIQREVNQRLIYESKWNTTCQVWKNESQRLLKETIIQANELKNNSIKIQSMADQIASLKIKINDGRSCPTCPACPQKVCPICPDVDCPEPQPCPPCEHIQCPICHKCQECPKCHDQEYNNLQNEYASLYSKFKDCENSVEQYQKNSQKPQSCSLQNQQEVKNYLRDELVILDNSLESGALVSQNLKEALKRATRKLSQSKTLLESISIVPALINAFTTELQELGRKQKDEPNCDGNQSKLLNDCMGLFKKAVDKLKDCEDKLTPYIAEVQV